MTEFAAEPAPDLRELAARALDAAARAGASLATAESLTGGLVAAALTGVAGASAVYRGGVVAYATELKSVLLGVDRALLSADGPVSAPVALAMARGVAARTGATIGVATTGVAGPAEQDRHPVGTVHVAVWSSRNEQVASQQFPGERAVVRTAAVRTALHLLLLCTVPSEYR